MQVASCNPAISAYPTHSSNLGAQDPPTGHAQGQSGYSSGLESQEVPNEASYVTVNDIVAGSVALEP